jgi:hypothetical protein
MRSLRSMPFGGLVAAWLLIALALAPATAAHEGITVGPYVIEIGWRDEPAYVGKSNAVEVTITSGDTAEPVIDLAPRALSVVVSAGGVDGPSIAFEPAFDAVAGTGSLGKYAAQVTPTTPGDHVLRLTGAIRETPVDLTVPAVVEVQPAGETSGPDPVLHIGGAALVLVVGGMAFLFLGVRSRPAEPHTDPPAR